MPVPKLVLGLPVGAPAPEKVEATRVARAAAHSSDVFGTDYYKVTTAARRAPRASAGRAKKVRVRYTFAAALELRLAEIETARQRSVTEHAAPGIPASRIKRAKPLPLPKLEPEPRAPGDVGATRWADTVAHLDDAPYAGRRLRPEQIPDLPDNLTGGEPAMPYTAESNREKLGETADRLESDKANAGRWRDGVQVTRYLALPI